MILECIKQFIAITFFNLVITFNWFQDRRIWCVSPRVKLGSCLICNFTIPRSNFAFATMAPASPRWRTNIGYLFNSLSNLHRISLISNCALPSAWTFSHIVSNKPAALGFFGVKVTILQISVVCVVTKQTRKKRTLPSSIGDDSLKQFISTQLTGILQRAQLLHFYDQRSINSLVNKNAHCQV